MTTRTAIVTTTINYPVKVLKKYAALDAHLIVVGDQRTPPSLEDVVRDLGGLYVAPSRQAHWHCSDAMGWNCIQRRNIGFLEAAAYGADIIISVDDDNLPATPKEWLCNHVAALTVPEQPRVVVGTKSPFFNPGSLLFPPVWARGMPYPEAYTNTEWQSSQAVDASVRVGVNAGLWTGDPDIDALQRISKRPFVHGLRHIERLTVRPGTWAPINSQNTAWRRELLPLAVVFPYIGRWDDILGGYTAQWSFWKAGFVTQYGAPLVHQERNDHDIYRDLALEIDGLRWTTRWIDMLEKLEASGDPLLDLTLLADTIEQDLDMDDHRRNAPVWQLRLAHFLRTWVRDWSSL